ncbi:MAG: hypothetical protein UR12_C0002G0008 [candidate division TM6 bacterium GW2011_GWF2_30_66]|nr:MAG: hypothetical protein UR12_C0002G0008 [candidate division TM6 bacterium GW2011_GWF2_30_66]
MQVVGYLQLEGPKNGLMPLIKNIIEYRAALSINFSVLNKKRPKFIKIVCMLINFLLIFKPGPLNFYLLFSFTIFILLETQIKISFNWLKVKLMPCFFIMQI